MLLFEGDSGADNTLRFLEEKGMRRHLSLDFTTRKMAWSDGFYELLGLKPGSVQPSYAAIAGLDASR